MKSAISLSARPCVGSSRISSVASGSAPSQSPEAADARNSGHRRAGRRGRRCQRVPAPRAHTARSRPRRRRYASAPPARHFRSPAGGHDRCDLEGIGHAGADTPMCRFGGDIASVKGQSVRGLPESGPTACRQRLSCRPRSDRSAHAPGQREGQIDILHGLQATEMSAEIARGQQAHGSHRIVRRRSSPTSPCGANRVSATSTRPAISI